MKVLINYADEKYRKTQKFNSWTGKHIAKFDKIYSFSPEDIEFEFFQKYKDILSIKRGNGLWLWKPYFISRVLSNLNEGDILFYCDAGSFFIKKIDKLIQSMNQNESIWVSDIPLIEKQFTKKQLFQLMDCNEKIYKDSNQIQATFIMMRKNKQSQEFIEQWLQYCCNFKMLCPSNMENEDNDFISHREDQSILSLLCKKEGVDSHRDPSQRGIFPEWYKNPNYKYSLSIHNDNDIYKNVIYLHKTPDVNIKTCIKQMLKCIYKKYFSRW